MSTYYTLYLEAFIDGKWICISPLARVLDPKPDEKPVRYVPLYEGGSRLYQFMSEYSDTFAVRPNDISDELKRELIPEEALKSLDDSKMNYWNYAFFSISGYELEAIEDLSRRRYSHCGFVDKATAERIKSGQAEEDDWPINEGDLPRELPEYVFNRLYEYVEYVQPRSDVWYAKAIMESVSEAIRGFNYANVCKGIALNDCRILYQIS